MTLKKMAVAVTLAAGMMSAQAATEVVRFEGLSGLSATNNNVSKLVSLDPGGALIGVGGFDWTTTTQNDLQLLGEVRATGNKGLTIGDYMGAGSEPLGQWVGFLNSTANVSFASKTVGSSFNFDGASFWAKAATTLTISGTLLNGSTVSETVNLSAQSLNTYVVAADKFDGVTAITFTGTNVVFDNVSVSAVPETSSYAMLLAGLGMMGCIARRRTRA